MKETLELINHHKHKYDNQLWIIDKYEWGESNITLIMTKEASIEDMKKKLQTIRFLVGENS